MIPNGTNRAKWAPGLGKADLSSELRLPVAIICQPHLGSSPIAWDCPAVTLPCVTQSGIPQMSRHMLSIAPEQTCPQSMVSTPLWHFLVWFPTEVLVPCWGPFSLPLSFSDLSSCQACFLVEDFFECIFSNSSCTCQAGLGYTAVRRARPSVGSILGSCCVLAGEGAALLSACPWFPHPGALP